MENSFKKIVPSAANPPKDVGDQVMGNIFFKRFLLELIEFFTAIFSAAEETQDKKGQPQ